MILTLSRCSLHPECLLLNFHVQPTKAMADDGIAAIRPNDLRGPGLVSIGCCEG